MLIATASLWLAASADPTVADRAIAAGGAAVGALCGGVVGASAALVAGAGLSGFNPGAGAVPYYALPPALTALGAGAGGAATGPQTMWAAGLAGLAGAGAATVAIELAGVLPQSATCRTSSCDVRNLALAIGAPSLVGAAAAAAAAAIFADGAELDAPGPVAIIR